MCMRAKPPATITALAPPRAFPRYGEKASCAFRSSIALFSVVLMVGMPFHALALPIPSKSTNGVPLADDDPDRLMIVQATETKDVAARLSAFGYTHEQVRATLDHLSPQDRHQLATNIEQLQAAGGKRTVLWVAVAIAVIVVLFIAAQKSFRHQHLISGSG